MKRLRESAFSWLPEKLGDIPGVEANILKVVAKTTSPTKHPDDPQYPLRIFPEKELELAARSLKQRPIGINHQRVIPEALVIDSEWNPEERQIEALLYVTPEIVSKVREGKINACSVEYNWRTEKKSGKGTIFHGLCFDRIDLLEGLDPGDPGVKVLTLFESEKGGRILMTLKESKEEQKETLKESCVWSQNYDSPEACIAANQDKEDPEAYCMAKVGEAKEQADPVEEPTEEPTEEVPAEEVKEVVEEKVEEVIEEVAPETPEEEKEEIAEEVAEEVTDEVTELKESITRLLEQNKKLKESKDEEVSEAKKEITRKLVEQLQKVQVHPWIESKWMHSAQRYSRDIKKLIWKLKQESK